MNNLYVSLKQHSDLLHFQNKSDEPNLRMSEVKPKLDRFIWSMLDNEEQEEWLNKKFARRHSERETQSLNYSVRVVSQEKFDANPVKKIDENYLLFQVKDTKKCKVNYGTVGLRFFSFHRKIIDEIKDKIQSFFLIHNFGYRQRKGFGSFTVIQIGETPDDQYAVTDINELFNQMNTSDLVPTWVGSIEMKEVKKDDLLFGKNAAISTLYKSLKSGINFRGYYKSYLIQKFKHKYSSEKFVIKQELEARGYKLKSKRNKIKHEYNNKRQERSIRLALGMGYEATYKLNDDSNVTLKYIYKDKCNKIVKRFPSPIMFKVIDKTIYVLLFATSYKTFMADSKLSVNIYKENQQELDKEINIVDNLQAIDPQEVNLSQLLTAWLHQIDKEVKSRSEEVSRLPQEYRMFLSNINLVKIPGKTR